MADPASQFTDLVKQKEDAEWQSLLAPPPSVSPPTAGSVPAPPAAASGVPTVPMTKYFEPGPGQRYLQEKGTPPLPGAGPIQASQELIGRSLKAIETGGKVGVGNVIQSLKTVGDGLERIFSFAPPSVVAASGELDRKMQGARNVVLGLVGLGLSPLTVPAGAIGQTFADSYPELAQREILDPRVGKFVRMMLGENPETAAINRPFTVRDMLETAAMMSAPIVAGAGSVAVRSKIASEATPSAPSSKPPRTEPQPAPPPPGQTATEAMLAEPPAAPVAGVQPVTPEAVQNFINQVKEPAQVPAAAIEGPRVFGVNLERMGLDEAAKTVMREVNRQLVDEGITAPERLKQTHEITLAKAIEKPMTIERALSLPMDQPLSASENTALRALNKALMNRLSEQAGRIVDDPGDLSAKSDMTVTLALAKEVSAKAKGVQTSIAQALEAQKLIPNETPGFMELLQRTQATSDMDSVAHAIASLPDAAKPTFWDNLIASSEAGRTTTLRLYQSSLLSNPRTHIKIFESQALRTFWNLGERAVARVNHQLFFSDDPNGVQNGEATAMLRGLGEGTIDGFKLAGKAWQTGSVGRLDMRDLVTGAPADAALDAAAATPRGWTLYDLATSPGRAVGAIDAFYKGVNYRMALKAEAVRVAQQERLSGQAYNDRTLYVETHPAEFPAIDARAQVLAQESAFQGPPGPAQTAFENIINEWHLSAIFPFKRAPGQLLKFGTQITPIVNFPSLMAGELGQQIRAGGASRELALARVELGAGVAVGAGYLAMTGHLTGAGPRDPSARAAWRAQGYEPYSVRIGENYYAYRWAEGLTAPLGLVADYMEIAGEIPDDNKAALAIAIPMAFARNTLDPTYLMSVRDFMDAITAPDKKAERFAESLGRSTVPAALRGVTETIDPTFKEVRSYLDAVMAGVPGNMLPPWRNEITGEALVRPPGVPTRMLSPITVSARNPDPVQQEIIDQHVKVSPTPWVINGMREPIVQMKEQVPGTEPLELTPEQRDRLIILKTQEIRDNGLTLRDALERLMNTTPYQSLPNWPQGDGKALQLQFLISKFSQMAQARLLQEDKDLQLTLMARKYEKLSGRVPIGTAPAPPANLVPFIGR